MPRKTERPAPAVLLSATTPEGADAALPAAVATPSAPPAAVAPLAAAAAAVVEASAEALAPAAPPKRPKAVKPAARTLAADKPAPAAKDTPMNGKAISPAKPAKSDKPAAPGADAEPAKAFVKPKLVRDSFTMPRGDFALIAVLKERALGFKRPAKKSELLRAGLHALAALDDVKLQAALEDLTPLKAGRPKKG
ncbi:hypothetical protein [uncultured Azohydromonas sp.]|uniref:hypothetical protein n=1 Tax=uncultured Azohydromonas sp. TaxID=487342 RepID=UPI002617EB8B|nr:hypothetical protein [uncultured Azohydromonas sp.]